MYSSRAVTAGFAAVSSAILVSDDSLNRAARFYSVAFPAYIHYEITDRIYKNSSEAERREIFHKLHARYSPIMRDNVLRMRGFFLKAAQLMSTREDFVPPEYLEWTTKMQNEAPVTFSSERAKLIVCDSFGLNSVNHLFSEWVDEPVGSASIGQVYRAKLKSDPKKFVAVKVQAPNAEKQFKSDLRACKIFCKLALPHLVVSLEEIERQFLTEFDYTLEANNLSDIRRNLIEEGPWGSKVVVPRPYVNLCSKNVLVMEFIEGRKVSDIFNEHLEEIAKREHKTVIEVKNEFKDKILKEGLTNVEHRWWQLTFNRMLNFFRPSKIPSVNVVDLLETAMKVHGYQIFVNGTFNGDPHPGNLILTPEGKLGLVDFGQVKRLDEFRLEQIARLITALNEDRKGDIVSIALEMGSRNKYNIPDVIYRLTAFWFDRDTPDVTQGLDIHKFLEEMERQDPQEVLCQDLVMVSRCSVMLRSLGLSLGLRVRTTDYWKDYAKNFLAQKSRSS
jgi:aarF domain-containing kinase